MKTLSKVTACLTALSLLAMLMQSCEVTQQAQQMYNLVNCDFRLQSVNNVTLAGVYVQNYHSLQDVTLADIAKLTAALTKPTFPLAFQLNLEGRNPNATAAGLNRFEYILFIDDIQMTQGTVANPVTIPPNNGIAVIPIPQDHGTIPSLGYVFHCGITIVGLMSGAFLISEQGLGGIDGEAFEPAVHSCW